MFGFKITEWRQCPEHDEKPTCACGANRICLKCGFGSVTYPCDCDRERTHDDLLDESLGTHSVIWDDMARR